jgi:2-polyprenyl-6-methoxyphenol hydroxylase-like FAD-dependent oxidoreductase
MSKIKLLKEELLNNAPNSDPIEALVIGAGPTGLTLAAQLCSFGTSVRIVDRLADRTQESRALAVQPRSLEILDRLGLADTLVQRGSTSARLLLHFNQRLVVPVPLADIPRLDSRFRSLLFVSQAETESVLVDHLASLGLTVERGVTLVSFQVDNDGVSSTLRNANGHEEHVRSRYLVGCDGAHSTVRKVTGVAFEGGTYLQRFMLADLEIDGPLERDAIHSFVGEIGSLMVFPLARPCPWRIIGMDNSGTGIPGVGPMATELSLRDLQLFSDAITQGQLKLHDPAWLTRFQLHHRQASRYRVGKVFLAGDAAHIHSPAGAQGMNTGIQDAWNLGWKLALVSKGLAVEALLDSYEAERWPVGRFLLRYTDRLFALFAKVTSASKMAAKLRNAVGKWVLPRLVAWKALRTAAFRTISQLNIRYRKSPAVAEGHPRLRRGPRSGDRLPDHPGIHDGKPTWLHQQLTSQRFTLLLCGSRSWPASQVCSLGIQYDALLTIRRVVPMDSAGDLEVSARVLVVLGAEDAAQYLVRPDGHIAFRCGGTQLEGVAQYLARWFPERPVSAVAEGV